MTQKKIAIRKFDRGHFDFVITFVQINYRMDNRMISF